jgi:hypothetical protein
VGMTADDPQCRIRLKTFHSEILNDHEALRKEEQSYIEIPPVRKLDLSFCTIRLLNDYLSWMCIKITPLGVFLISACGFIFEKN